MKVVFAVVFTSSLLLAVFSQAGPAKEKARYLPTPEELKIIMAADEEFRKGSSALPPSPHMQDKMQSCEQEPEPTTAPVQRTKTSRKNKGNRL